MVIDTKESNYHFANNHTRQLDFNPDGLEGVVMEWCENTVSGSINPMTRKDDRKYTYRVRAVRISTLHILMDTGKYMPINRAEALVHKFIAEQKEMDDLLYNRG